MPRERLSVTVPKELVEWLRKQVDERKFFNLSHGVEEALRRLKESEG